MHRAGVMAGPFNIFRHIFSFAHLGDGKTLGFLTNVTDDDDYHFRQVHWTGALDRCTSTPVET